MLWKIRPERLTPRKISPTPAITTMKIPWIEILPARPVRPRVVTVSITLGHVIPITALIRKAFFTFLDGASARQLRTQCRLITFTNPVIPMTILSCTTIPPDRHILLITHGSKGAIIHSLAKAS
jgi:hypothetical protein